MQTQIDTLARLVRMVYGPSSALVIRFDGTETNLNIVSKPDQFGATCNEFGNGDIEAKIRLATSDLVPSAAKRIGELRDSISTVETVIGARYPATNLGLGQESKAAAQVGDTVCLGSKIDQASIREVAGLPDEKFDDVLDRAVAKVIADRAKSQIDMDILTQEFVKAAREMCLTVLKELVNKVT